MTDKQNTENPENAQPVEAADCASAPPPVTTFEKWTLIIQVIGHLLVVISLGFIAFQTYQTAQQAKLTAQQAKLTAFESGLNQMSAIDNIFVEHPEVYPYFYEGKVITQDDPEYFKVLAVAMAVTNYLEANLPRDGTDPMPEWGKYTSDQFAISPIMCEYLEHRKDWFDPRLVKIMREAKARTNSPLMSGATDSHIGKGK